MVESKEKGSVSSSGEKTTLSEQIGVIVFSLVMFFGGGALIVADFNQVTNVIGGILAIIGLISFNASVWALLKSFWSR
jgi:hypothetical protein